MAGKIHPFLVDSVISIFVNIWESQCYESNMDWKVNIIHEIWIDVNFEKNHFQVGPGDEVDWLRSDMEESPVIAVKKKSLVNKLDDLARREFCLLSLVNMLDDLGRCEFKLRCPRFKSQMKMAVD